MDAEPSVRVEDKLYYNRYLVDIGRPHVKVRAHTSPIAAASCAFESVPRAML
ncbi:ferredoxin-like protein FixX [Bradyrhizobium sp. USDA 4508]